MAPRVSIPTYRLGVSGPRFQSMFNGASSFNSDVSAWQVSQATTFYAMFYGASSFNSDVSAWQSAGHDFRGMFCNLELPIPTCRLGKSHRTRVSSMFNGASSFNSDVSAWQVSSHDFPKPCSIAPRDSIPTYRLGKSRRPRLSSHVL